MPEETIEEGWFVSSGEYSDYRVNYVFDKKEDAVNWAKVYGGFAESVLKNPKAPTAPDGLTRFRVLINPPDGKNPPVSVLDWPGGGTFPVTPNPFETAVYRFDWNNGTTNWQVHLWAEDRQHAAKIANEIRSRLLTGNYDESKILKGN